MKWLSMWLDPWVWKMAWRESRGSRAKLWPCALSVSLGIGALAGIASLSANLREAIAKQTRAFVGADLVLTARHPFSKEMEDWIQKIPGAAARETSFSTMLVIPKAGGAARLANARGLTGDFPFYGRLEVEPLEAESAFRNGEGALIEQTLLNQFDLKPGDEIRIGKLTTRVAGALLKVPGDALLFGTIAPRVYFSGKLLPETHLIEGPSIARYRAYFRFNPGADPDAWVKANRPKLEEYHLEADTVTRRKEDLGEAFKNQEHFLTIVALAALLLGGIGMAAGIASHLQPKMAHVAILRCLGATTDKVFAIYVIQSLALGVLGAISGLAAGILVQQALPVLASKFLPFGVDTTFQWLPAIASAAAGLLLCAAFAFLPLLPLRRISPLAVIRIDFGVPRPSPKTAERIVYLFIVVGLVLFSVWRAANWRMGLIFAGGLIAVFLILTGTAWLLRRAASRMIPAGFPFAWRQGLANLERPQNRTLLVLVSVGLGAFLLLTLQLTRDVLLKQLFPVGQTNQPNAILFDIQPDQREGVLALLKKLELPVLEDAPMVTMRLANLKGRTAESWANDPTKKLPSWALRREYRSTWRTHLNNSERIISGQFVPTVAPETSPVPVSVEEGIARDLQLKLGDEFVFDVQGIPITNRVASLRKVDWRQIRPNFFVVFPAGVLESAPSMTILGTHVGGPAQSADMQRELVKAFPNVSVIDLILVLRTLDGIVEKIGFAVRVMALFTVVSGLIVLASAIGTGRTQRLREAVLLRTLGASRSQIRQSLVAEYLALGVLAAATGGVLSLAAAWNLAHWVFNTEMVFSIVPFCIALVSITVVTVGMGLAASRGIGSHPPLEVLRRET